MSRLQLHRRPFFAEEDVKQRDQDAPPWALDPSAPWVRPAGVTTLPNEEGIKDVLAWRDRPDTPPEQRRFRQSTMHEPGRQLRHWGAAQDPLPAGPFGGRRGSDQARDGVGACIRAYPQTEISRWEWERAEDSYGSSIREPLGRSYVRGHKLPQGMGSDIAFGRPLRAKVNSQGGQARSIIYPTDVNPEQSDAQQTNAHRMYVVSHADYAPGEQRRRGYAWQAAGVDPATHRFGAVPKGDCRGAMQQALQPGLDQQGPVVASAIHEAHKLSSWDYLGRPRMLGTGDRPELPRDHAFGKPSRRRDGEPGMAELLQGDYSEYEQQPDGDLGKSLHEGWRNMGPKGRVYGVPSVRCDVPMPREKSVADTTNYGNEPNASQLIRPPISAERGIGEQHYLRLRGREETWELAQAAGMGLGPEEFEGAFRKAAQADGQREACSLNSFFQARHRMLAQRLGLVT